MLEGVSFYYFLEKLNFVLQISYKYIRINVGDEMKIKISFIICILVICISNCYAIVSSYTVEDKYYFKNNGTTPNGAFIEIFIGSINETNYQKGTITISPKPTRYIFDDYGNRIARYDIGNSKIKNYTISIKKDVEVSDYTKNITAANASQDVKSIYLRPCENIESNDARIIEKANELTQNCKNDYEKVKNIFEFVNMHISYDVSVQYRNKGALSGLLTGRGVCEEYATLFVALCRASNIPARVLTGFRTEGLEKGEMMDTTTIYHAWVEVYFEGYGWVPSEVTAEYYVNGNKTPYWNGFLTLDKPIYVVEGVYNIENNEIVRYGIDLADYSKNIKLNSTMYYSDINSHWAKDSIENMSDKNIINGYEDNTYKPDSNVSRIEYIALLARTMKYENKYYYTISDIYYPSDFITNWSKNDYDSLMKYYAYYLNDYNNGAGYKTINYVFGNKLKMDDPITRQEVVALLDPFLTDLSYKTTNLTDISNSKFKDEIVSCYANSIINGYPDNTFKPNGYITRAEIATILDRYTK